MNKNKWTTSDIPDQSGRTAIVTGANSGIGYESALALAKKGAHVVLACRSRTKGEEAIEKIKASQPSGSVELMLLDLNSLDSVRAFAGAFNAAHDRLDILINNAGVMMPPFGITQEGYELQIGVNYIGHFALTGLLFDKLTTTPQSRIVTLSSLAHRQGKIDFETFTGENLQNGADYKPMAAYMQSKLADLMYAIELQRRLTEEGWGTISVAAHPGFTATDLQRHSGLWNRLVGFWSNDPPQGALPTLYAATSPDAKPGGYYGPDGFYEARGYPASSKVMPHARDRQVAGRLWSYAEEATGVRFL
ncbi:MAG: SDR family NAD(P)-dependent oxidoreductase [Bacteroidetes bacterium]|nr:SDR family NAD(P)-dependent oxidoreductase [Bacteroidota bacterium]